MQFIQQLLIQHNVFANGGSFTLILQYVKMVFSLLLTTEDIHTQATEYHVILSSIKLLNSYYCPQNRE